MLAHKSIVICVVILTRMLYANSETTLWEYDTVKHFPKIQEPVRFALIGHLYPARTSEPIMKGLINKINTENPDYLFILGDSHCWDDSMVTRLKSEIDSKIFFAPGNHDLKQGRKEKYLKNIGYLNKVLISSKLNFILLNTSESAESINRMLSQVFLKLNSNNPVILLGHHRIWDDNLIDSLPYSHDKCFYFHELLPVIRKKVQYIFAGNSNTQYFGYQYSNTNVAFWSEIVEGIKCYSIGMGNGIPKATYVMVEYNGRELSVLTRNVIFENYEKPVKKQEKAEEQKLNKAEVYRLIRMVYISKKFWLGVILTCFIWVIIIRKFYKKK